MVVGSGSSNSSSGSINSSSYNSSVDRIKSSSVIVGKSSDSISSVSSIGDIAIGSSRVGSNR